MLSAKLLGFFFAFVALSSGIDPPTAKTINDSLAHLTIDAGQIYRVRDLRLNRGGVKLYLNEGVLAFATPVEGKVVAAVFTTRGIEAGDAEVLALPPSRSERTSLASYTKSPNLNDHFNTAVFFFSDDTVRECLEQMSDLPAHRASELASELRPVLDPILQNLYPSFGLNLVDALLDQHPVKEGFFYATVGGRDLGPFNLLFDPANVEPVTIGQFDTKQDKFQLWTSFGAAHAVQQLSQTSRFSNYRIHAKVSEALRLSAKAEFAYRCDDADGRSLRFDLSDRLSVTAASIDGEPVETFERKAIGTPEEAQEAGAFLLVRSKALVAGPHEISVSYEGEVIRHTKTQTYFVEARNTWYPHAGNTAASFDLTFDCPQSLQLVSTGELISETIENGVRTVHRRTPVAENVAGFNLGEYRVTHAELSPYRVDLYANRSGEFEEELGPKTASILQTYSQWWSTLPFHSIAVTPITGNFGQGFPGLIYLSDISYVRQTRRPATLRTPRMDSFFSDMLLPHEVAHQWWGNLVTAADYRAGWITEAMSTHSALEYLTQQGGEAAMASVLAEYKKDLQLERNGKRVEAAGPVDFGVRLVDSAGKEAWQVITYEKGAWVLRMLQTRLGPERWRQLQLKLLRDFTARPLTNDAFRQAAADLLPPGQADRDLQLFFETWVYSTGVPRLTITKRAAGWELELSQVADDFIADIPISCHTKAGREESVRWVRAAAGTNMLPSSENSRVCSLPPTDRFLYVE